MKRFANVRKTITAAMAALIVFGAGAVATQAGFNDTKTATVEAGVGTVTISAAGTSGATVTFNSGKLLKNGTYTGTLEVTNGGTLPVNVTFTKPTGQTISGGTVLQLQTAAISGSSGTAVAGTKAALGSFVPPQIKNLQPDATVTMTFTLTVPKDASAEGVSPVVQYTLTADPV